jgi:hypothetical protein
MARSFQSWTITRLALPTARCRSAEKEQQWLALLLDQGGCLGASPKASAFVVRVLAELRSAG